MQEGSSEEAAGSVGSEPSLGEWLRRASPEDLLTAGQHSRDFGRSRAELLFRRVRLLALAFAAGALLWIPMDFWFLEGPFFAAMLGLRIAFSGACLGLGLWRRRPHDLFRARLRLTLLVLLPLLFYVGARAVVGGGLPAHGMWVGYSFLPFLIVALLGIFPLTLTEGLSLSALVAAFMLGTDLFFNTLGDVARLRDAWLLGLLIAIALWGQMAQLHMLLRLYREATRDALTGLVNRRGLIRWLGQELNESQGRGKSLSVLLFDLDLFKRINDSHGHLTGDRILQRFARVLSQTMPDNRLLGRYGGEEFLAVLPRVDSRQATELAEAVREACHRTPIITPDGAELSFTVSVGVATLHAGEGTESLISRVDQSLYQAKEAGRDLVVQAS